VRSSPHSTLPEALDAGIAGVNPELIVVHV
jgi:hypothetical protein